MHINDFFKKHVNEHGEIDPNYIEEYNKLYNNFIEKFGKYKNLILRMGI